MRAGLASSVNFVMLIINNLMLVVQLKIKQYDYLANIHDIHLVMQVFGIILACSASVSFISSSCTNISFLEKRNIAKLQIKF